MTNPEDLAKNDCLLKNQMIFFNAKLLPWSNLMDKARTNQILQLPELFIKGGIEQPENFSAYMPPFEYKNKKLKIFIKKDNLGSKICF